MKSVLYVGGFELPNKNAAAQRVIANGRILNKLGYRVVYLGVNKENQNIQIYNKMQYRDSENVFLEESHPINSKKWLEYITSIRKIISICEQYDISSIIAYNFPAIALYKMKKFCKKNNMKIYSDCTEWYEITNVTGMRDFIKKMDIWLRMRVVHKKMDGVICISNFLYDTYKDSCKCIIVPPLVDLLDEKWDMASVGEDDDYIKLTYAGSPGISKGKDAKDRLDIVIKLLADISDKFLFRIVGITKEEYIKIFPEQLNMINNMQRKIQFVGRKNHEEVIQILKNSDFSIFTRNISRVSLAGFPTKFVEAISVGIPVITNDTSDLKKYIHNWENGLLIDINNEITAKKELRDIIKLDRESIEKMKFKCKNSRMFDYNNYFSEFEDLGYIRQGEV